MTFLSSSKQKIITNTTFMVDKKVASKPLPDPVLISGFWRSGTTWVQEVLADAIGAKTIFEPLEPSALIPLHYNAKVQYGAYIPFSEGALQEEDIAFLVSAAKGISPARSQFCYLCRNSIKEAFRKQVVVKFVRAQYLLSFLSQLYATQKITHISRNPMAVIQSLMRTNWVWDFESLDFKKLYMDEMGSLEHKDLTTLLKYNNAKPEEKIAALWALTEKKVHATDNIIFYKYEDLLTDPIVEFKKLADDLNLSVVKDIVAFKASPVTEQDRLNIGLEERLNSWHTRMPEEVQENARKVLRSIWPEVDDKWNI